MKRANMKLNFDTITAFGQPINLIVTKSGHYTIPITNNKHILHDLNTTRQHIILPLTNKKSDRYSNETSQTVCTSNIEQTDQTNKLRNGQEWRNNKNLTAEILKVTNECNTCQILKKNLHQDQQQDYPWHHDSLNVLQQV